jgi:putative flippase GtrA
MLRRQILLFAVSGVLGLCVDAGIVQWLVRELGMNPYAARVLSFLAAATATWGFNRRYTFAGHGDGSRRRQWLRYLAAMAFGFVLNYGVYAACVTLWPLAWQWPALGVAAGSAAGAVVNFLSSKYWIFRAVKAPVAEGVGVKECERTQGKSKPSDADQSG